jgi:asparagine synthase (glutamine-hydrolysing)
MCGIVGQVRADGAPVEPELLERMCVALEHRGPDARGIHAKGGTGLGVQRLRIIDLQTGDQPIYNEDRSVVVVLNGEIYNFRELRERLIAAGHTFATQSDTEVIVHLYEEEGVDCVRSLHGMFGFALWDERRRQLLLARDRVGKKPLFYSHRDGVLSFASELNALMQDPGIPREIDHQAIDCYLSYQHVPSPLSAFKAARKLPPASRLLHRDDRVEIDRFWSLDYSSKREVDDLPALHEELRETIKRATQRRMVADVPLGAFLSGGVDSSAIVAAMAEASSEPVKTFSIGFEHQAFDELPFARRIAQEFGTDHHEYVVKANAVEILPRIVHHYGEPFADASAIPSFYVAEITRRHVTVALNGDGGDESFAGYNRYVSNLMAHRLERLPRPLRRLGAAVGERLPSNPNARSTLNRIRRLSRSLTLEPADRYARHMSYFDWVHKDALYTPEYKEMVGQSLATGVIRGPWHHASGASRLDVLLETDVNTYLPGDLLVKMDIATMAHSLEARSPLLDPEVMELAASLPAELKLRGMEKKVVLRDALRGWIPESILDRPKQGFGVPIPEWFRNDLRDYVCDVLLDPVTLDRGYFRQQYVRSMLDSHFQGREDTSPRLWALLMLELWHREFVDKAPRPMRASARLAEA